jgi:4-amino-4-deoxy-L-arabinose transferase-like glycosyltransferase
MNDRRTLALVAGGALVMRLLLLVARGDYIIYDEGYYLLLARSLASGHGFTLNGLPHVALSPLQPLIVAGLSLTGLPDLWASRLLAAVTGAALVFPVAFLARRWGGARAAVPAAVFVATAPALLSFVPFRSGQWNLYFGSEPLFLLLGTSLMVAAIRAVDTGTWRAWVALGALSALAFLTRLEGAVLGAATGAVAVGFLAAGRRWRELPRAGVALSAGLLVALPYFAYLRSTLGRWTVSGRVQAASGPLSVPSADVVKARRRDALQRFVWGGDREVLWRALYSLDPSGTRMHSQYWGVAPAQERAASAPEVARRSAAAAAEAEPLDPPLPSLWRQLGRALWIDLSWWLIVLGTAGLYVLRARAAAMAWLLAPLATIVVPGLLAYVEPRAMLIAVPIACALSGVAVAADVRPLESRLRRRIVITGVLLLLTPAAADLVRAWPQRTPLQRAASARRAVGAYLGAHLDSADRIVSWHPALAIWARRDWRVLPYDSLAPIVRYARAQQARVLVFSTFDPSPLRDPPRAFTVLLLDSASGSGRGDIRLEQVDATPLVLVGRLAPDSARRDD